MKFKPIIIKLPHKEEQNLQTIKTALSNVAKGICKNLKGYKKIYEK